MRIFFPRLPKTFTRHLPERLLITILFIGALALAYWNLHKRYPLIEDYQKKILEVRLLEETVREAKSKYPETVLKETEPGYLRALELVFTNQEHIKLWFDYFQRRAEAIGLEMQPYLVTNISINTPKAPIFLYSYRLNLKPIQVSTNFIPVHERLLSFLYELSTNQYKRLDFMELKASGDGNQLEQAVVGIQLWYFTNAP